MYSFLLNKVSLLVNSFWVSILQLSKVASNNVGDLGTLAQSLTRDYAALADETRGAVACSPHPELAARLLRIVQDLGNVCIDVVKDAGHLQGSPGDSFARTDLSEHTRKVSEKVSQVLATLQAGARGTQACINAASTVSGIIGDLDTTIMFATAGTLNADGDEAFSDHRLVSSNPPPSPFPSMHLSLVFSFIGRTS